jgi:AcrR family transcriptional regulator
MSPRPDVSEERNNQILEAATAVFARAGFQQTRMDDIACLPGLSKGALYLYNTRKDAVITALLTRFFRQASIHLQRFLAAPREESIAGQFHQLTRQFASAMQWMEKLKPSACAFYALGRAVHAHTAAGHLALAE